MQGNAREMIEKKHNKLEGTLIGSEQNILEVSIEYFPRFLLVFPRSLLSFNPRLLHLLLKSHFNHCSVQPWSNLVPIHIHDPSKIKSYLYRSFILAPIFDSIQTPNPALTFKYENKTKN